MLNLVNLNFSYDFTRIWHGFLYKIFHSFKYKCRHFREKTKFVLFISIDHFEALFFAHGSKTISYLDAAPSITTNYWQLQCFLINAKLQWVQVYCIHSVLDQPPGETANFYFTSCFHYHKKNYSVDLVKMLFFLVNTTQFFPFQPCSLPCAFRSQRG